MTRRMKRILVASALLVAGGAAWGAYEVKREKPVVVQTALVERVPALTQLVSASGTVEAKESVDIQAEIAGVIVDLPVKEGDWVEKGAVLARIDPFQTDADLQAMRANLAAAVADAKGQEVQVALAQANVARELASKKAAEAELVQSQARLERADSLWRRRKDLFDKGVTPTDELEAAQSELRAAKALVDALQARVDQFEAQARAARLTIEQVQAVHEAALERAKAARAHMQRAEDSLKKTTIFSPLKGLITARKVERGERAVPGTLLNPEATLMTIADLSEMEARLLVDETDIVQVARDQKVRVVVDALPEQPIEGIVYEIGNSPVNGGKGQLSGSQEGKDFVVKARLVAPPPRLRPGMSCEGEVTTAVKSDVLVIPIQALARREMVVDEAGRPVPEADEPGTAAALAPGRQKEVEGVFLRGGDRRARFLPVETGIAGGMDIEVRAGLAEGQEIVLGPFKVLRSLAGGELVEVDNSHRKRYARSGGRPGEP